MLKANEIIIEKLIRENDVLKKIELLYLLRKHKDVPLTLIAKKLKCSPSYLCHLLRLKKLPEMIIDGYLSQLVSLSHLFVISRIRDQDKLLKAYEKILERSLTVAQTEELVRENLYQIKTQGSYLENAQKNEMIKNITQDNSNIKVKIIQTRIKSKLVVEIRGELEKTTRILKSIALRLIDRDKT